MLYDVDLESANDERLAVVTMITSRTMVTATMIMVIRLILAIMHMPMIM